MICNTSFDTIPNRFNSPKSSTIPDLEKSLLCKERSLTRVLFDIEAHNFAWDEDLKNMDGKTLTFRDIRTFCFFVIGFLGVVSLAWVDKQNAFLMEGDGDGRDLEEDMDPLFFGSFQYESKLSSISSQVGLLLLQQMSLGGCSNI